jgi:glycosyltransferase involved in cell wall biosynthesis
MTDSALVSVVIPAYNAERFLGETLDSVFAQTYEPLEVIVIDDGSTDGTAEVARRYPVNLLGGPNGGRSVARNRGIEASTGELIAFCDADDVWLPKRVEAEARLLGEDPELSIASCMLQGFLEPGTPPPPWIGRYHLEPRRAAEPSALLVRRELLERVGVFDPGYVIAQDYDLLARAVELGAKIGFVDEILVRYRIHDANSVHDRELMRKEMFRVLRSAAGRRRQAGEAAG